MVKIMVVDDEQSICWAFEQFLKGEGYVPVVSRSVKDALEKLSTEKPDIVFMDIKMPGDMDGLDALEEMKKIDPDVYVIIMTAYGTMQTAIRAIQLGAFDHILKPLDLTQIKLIIEKALKIRRQSRELQLLRSEVLGEYHKDNIVGKSPQMQEIYKLIGMLTTNDVTVLIQGETGVGKELVAKAIHYNSPRRDKPFVAVNCAALTESLLESELFGHEKGAFTGAVSTKLGKFEVAGEGTIFLDEIGDISHKMQTQLLRVLDNKTFERVGSNKPQIVRARIIASTNKDLEKAVKDGSFRADLYYRLKVFSIYIPPLRERKEDIPLLVQHFIRMYNEKFGKQIEGVDDRVMRILMEHDWEGNVRELENLIKSAMIVCKGNLILPEHIPLNKHRIDLGEYYPDLNKALDRVLQEKINSGSSKPYDEITEYVQSYIVNKTIERYENNQVKAASVLGISRTTLRKKAKIDR